MVNQTDVSSSKEVVEPKLAMVTKLSFTHSYIHTFIRSSLHSLVHAFVHSPAR